MIDYKLLARQISLVENEADGYEELLRTIQPEEIPVIGITGPPGAGKSTLLNGIAGALLKQGKRLGLVLVDPSSPFHNGAVLGDRLRLSAFFNHPDLFIRSVASRGALGGLSGTIVEIIEVMKSFPFDYIFIETVGVGQSEVEIAGLADATIVVLVPEAGDSIQTMKAGLMEIADVFVVNKADRSDADALTNALKMQLEIAGKPEVKVLKAIAVEGSGIDELIEFISARHRGGVSEKRIALLTEKIRRIIQKRKMKNFNTEVVRRRISERLLQSDFNLFKMADEVERMM